MRIIYHSIHLILCSKSFSESWSRAYLIYEYVLVALAYEYVHAATLRYPGFQSIISKKPLGRVGILVPTRYPEILLRIPSYGTIYPGKTCISIEKQSCKAKIYQRRHVTLIFPFSQLFVPGSNFDTEGFWETSIA